MPQSLTSKAITTFTGGLITEAGELTFPEGASVDELNCSLEKAGNRRRRLGLHYEDASVLSSNTVNHSTAVHEETWSNVANQSNLEYLLVQVGTSVYFYSKAASPLSGGTVDTTYVSGVPYVVDLTTYKPAGISDADIGAIQVASIKGAAVVVAEGINPFYITQDIDTGAFTETTIDFKARDFEFLGDKTASLAEVATGSVTLDRQYDTANAGWTETKGAAALSTYLAADTAYSPLAHPWYSGKDASGNFSESEWQKVYSGTTLIVGGHYILGIFDGDRATASGIASVTGYTTLKRFTTTSTFFGRIFYSGLSSDKDGGRVYFTSILESLGELGDCYQQNDPTAEDFSDLLDTDGGFISIPEAHNIRELQVFGSSLLVFADNGVWAISGVDGVFRATEFSVTKITTEGLHSTGSLVDVEGAPIWWSASGIQTMVADQVSGRPNAQNLSTTTIQTFWNEIGGSARSNVKGLYDSVAKKVFWIYPELTETKANKYNRVLILDLTLQAFVPWTVEDEDTAEPKYILGMSYFSGVGSVRQDIGVTVDGVQVTAGGVDVTVSGYLDTTDQDSAIKFLVRDATGALTFAEFSGEDFLDWASVDYSSFAEAGYDFLGDMTLKKTAPFVTTYMRTTETGYTGDETNGYNPIRPSSCKMSVYWDFKTSASTTAQQIYRFKRIPIIDTGDLSSFDYPTSVITTRNKIRGKGRSMKLRFESETGKDFNLLGYEVIGARNTTL